MARGAQVPLLLVLLVALGGVSQEQSPGANVAGESARAQAAALVVHGLARDAVGARDEALADFSQAIASHALAGQDLSRVLYDRGVVLDELGRTNDALGDYSAAIEASSDFAPALNNRANALRRLNRLREAKRDYLAALAAGDPHPEYADFGLGEVARAEDALAAARGYYERALRADPAFTPARDALVALTVREDASGLLARPNANAIPDLHRSGSLASQAVTVHLAPASYGKPLDPPPLRPAVTDLARIDKPTPPRGPEQIQIGAWRDEASAAEGWNRALRQSAGALSGMTPSIVAADIPGKGRYYRLRAQISGSASALCERLHELAVTCMVAARD